MVRGALIILGITGLAWASGPNLDRARKLYNLTEFQQSLEVLQAVPNKDAAVYELMGRDYYGQGEFKKATEALEKAAALQPEDSNIHLWLGRAYGRRAETSSLITAPGFANKARQYFEKAAQLSPQSGCSERSLRVLPGGSRLPGRRLGQGAATAERIAQIDPAEGYWAQAKIAEKRKEFSRAEEHLRRAVEACAAAGRAAHRPGQVSGQTGPLSRRPTRVLPSAEKIAPNSPKLMFAKADLYIKQQAQSGCRTRASEAIPELRTDARRSAARRGREAAEAGAGRLGPAHVPRRSRSDSAPRRFARIPSAPC